MANKDSEILTGEDMSAPEMEAMLGGRAVKLRFDHNQMRFSEHYWHVTMREKMGYYGIIDQAIARTYSGLGALCYGAAASAAIAAGREPIACGAFDRLVRYDELRPLAKALMDCVIASLPKPKKKPASSGQETGTQVTHGQG